MRFISIGVITALLVAPAENLLAQTNDSILDFIDGRYEETAEIARTIWEHAEVGYQETQSSALLQQSLDGEGFEIRWQQSE